MKKLLLISAAMLISFSASAEGKSPKDKVWNKIVDKVFDMPHATTGHTCDSKDGICVTWIKAPLPEDPDGGSILLMYLKDYQAEAVIRQVCRETAIQDVRTCIDHDSGNKYVYVKDTQTGHWEQQPKKESESERDPIIQ